MSKLERLRWVSARLRAMSAAEMAWRARRALAVGAHRAGDRLGFGRQLPLERVVAPAATGEGLLFGAPPLGYLPWEGAGRADLARALAAVLSVPGEPPAADWNLDTRSGRRFPLRHYSTIDYRRPADEAAIRRLWYRARQRELAAVAMPYYLAQDEDAAWRAGGMIASWIEQCPPYRGIHWLVPLELALRLVAWSTAARLVAGSAALAALAPRLAAAVHLQAEQVLGNLSRYSSANNHLIAQAAGLLHAGIGFSGLKRAPVWRRTGREILWAELLRQTTPDGVSREASLHYHEFVLELALLGWLLLRANGEEPPAAVRDRLAAMLDFLAAAADFPGGAPALGDSDDQSVLPLGAEEPRRTLLALGAVLYDRGGWKTLAGGLTPAAAFLLGEEGRERFAELAAERPAGGSRLYGEAGYALLRDASGDRALLFDAGELGYLATAAHGHADCLAIVLGAFGESLLVDPGTYTYHAEPRFRDYFRSTAAHSTLRIDGLEQSEMRGAFLWGRRARGRFVEWASWPAADLAIGEHDGYERLRPPMRHRRLVVFVKPDFVWVIDEVDGSGEHLIESFLHFAPEMRLAARGQSALVAAKPTGVTLLVLVPETPGPEIDCFHGCERPLQGWVSPAFGERRPAPVVRLVKAGRLPAALHLVLRPRAGAPADAGPESATVTPLASGHLLHARGMPGEDLAAIGSGHGVVAGAGRFAGEIEVDARFALVRRGEEEMAVCVGHGLRRLLAGGRLLAAASTPLDFCYCRQGEQAVVEGRGGRLRLWAPGVREVRRNGGPLAIERHGDWIDLDLGRAGGESPKAQEPVL